MTPIQALQSPVDTLGHSGVQPWSAGALFPGVISRVETYAEPAVIGRDYFTGEFVELTLSQRLIATQWRAIYGADERLCDTYEEAEAWIATRKELDEEEKPYGRQADGIYQGELAGVQS